RSNPQSSIRHPMRHRLEYLIVRLLIALVRVMPGPLVRAGGTILGLALYGIDRGHRRIAQRNLTTAFPTRRPAERRAIARAAFAHFGRLLFELLRFGTLSPAKMLARVEFDGEERSRLAYAQGRGVLFVTGHFGFWELQAMVHALRVEPVSILARALGGGRYRMIYEHPIEPPRADSTDAVRELTQRCTDVLEMYVRRHPELWLWMHRRWRDNGPAADGVRGMFLSAEQDEADSGI